MGKVVLQVGNGGGGGLGTGPFHLPKHLAFSDMLAGEGNQAVSQKYRVGSLRDMFILCMTEVGVE